MTLQLPTSQLKPFRIPPALDQAQSFHVIGCDQDEWCDMWFMDFKYDSVLVFGPQTQNSARILRTRFPGVTIHHSFQPLALIDFRKIPTTNKLLILIDCQSNVFNENRDIREIHLAGRYFDTSVVSILHDQLETGYDQRWLLPLSIRSNITYLIAFPSVDLQVLFQCFGLASKSQMKFAHEFQARTAKANCALIIDNTIYADDRAFLYQPISDIMR